MVFFKLTILSCLIAVIASASFDAKTTTTKAATTKATTTTTQGPSLLNVTVVEIGDTWARFQVIGDDNLYNYPVESVNVDYHIVSDSKVLNSKISPRSLLSQTSSQFKDNITLKGLEPGQVYSLKFSAINTKKQVGPPSHEVKVLLLPSTPSIVVAHPEPRKLVVKWNKSNSKREDYFILEVFKVFKKKFEF